jgi:hypothetical protein
MEYALKLHRAGERPAWRSNLLLREAFLLASASVEEEERSDAPRYLTATIYRGAMVVNLIRYFPPAMRTKTGRPPVTPSNDED